MPIQPIEVKRLYSQIAEQITTLIGAGEFSVGDRLPAERDLCSRLGVSRSSLREALIALEIEGTVEVRSGSGIYVLAKDQSERSRGPSLQSIAPFDVIRARAYLEPEIAVQAVRNASDAQIEDVLSWLKRLRQCDVGDPERNSTDRGFHLSLAEASGNGAYVLLIDQLWVHRTTPLYHKLENHFFGVQWWAEAMEEHEEIYAALKERDVRRISMAIGMHMQHAEQRLAAQFK